MSHVAHMNKSYHKYEPVTTLTNSSWYTDEQATAHTQIGHGKMAHTRMSHGTHGTCTNGICHNFMQNVRLFSKKSPKSFAWRDAFIRICTRVRVHVYAMRHVTPSCKTCAHSVKSPKSFAWSDAFIRICVRVCVDVCTHNEIGHTLMQNVRSFSKVFSIFCVTRCFHTYLYACMRICIHTQWDMSHLNAKRALMQ